MLGSIIRKTARAVVQQRRKRKRAAVKQSDPVPRVVAAACPLKRKVGRALQEVLAG